MLHRRIKAVSFVCSIGLHLLFVSILWRLWSEDGALQSVSYGDGPAVAVDLVRGLKIAALQPVDHAMNVDPATTLSGSSSNQTVKTLGHQSQSTISQTPSGVAASRAPQPSATPIPDEAKSEGGLQATADPTIAGVMAEIARCLPVGMRPQLALATLTLTVDENGKLAAAPAVAFSSASVSPSEAKAADQVVQAALQCGPYEDPAVRGHTLAMTADFSAASLLAAK